MHNSNRSTVSNWVNPNISYYSSSRSEFYKQAVFPAKRETLFTYPEGYTTQTDIQVADVDWNSSEEEFLKKWGKPRFTVYLESSKVLRTIHFFRMSESDNLRQFHFIGTVLYYTCTTILNIKKTDKVLIRNRLVQKYAQTEIPEAFDPLIFSDGNKNKVILSDNVYFQIGYLSGKHTLSELTMIQDTMKKENIKKLSFQRIRNFLNLF
jgi:hypothetical protein